MDWGFRFGIGLGIRIGDSDRGLRLGTGDWGLGIEIGDWDWGLRSGIGMILNSSISIIVTISLTRRLCFTKILNFIIEMNYIKEC